MRSIVGELKGYSASDRPGPTEAVPVAQAVSSALNIAQNEIRHRARLEREHEPGLFVRAREGQLVQVLVNLLVNAAQAIPSQDAIDHLICVTSRRLSDSRVEIVVSDTGAGIPEAALAHVFDPFATGKQRGEGAGLGLTISKRIVEDFGGSIRIESKSGSGTVVTLELPRTEAPSIPAPVELVLPEAKLPRARVLIIDDELPVAKGLKRMLVGHDVVILRDGHEALELLRREPSFDVVLCDLMMPSLPGSELFRRVTRDHPELGPRFVFMTGGAFTDYGRSFLEKVDCPVLKKPFDPKMVMESIRNAMLTNRQPLSR
jgi:CheY-like chemotaxis protein/anti-sigma regulatory factor (Ser/Thr protein kinase)